MQRQGAGANRNVGLFIEGFRHFDPHAGFRYIQGSSFGEFLLPHTVLPRQLDQRVGGYSRIPANPGLFFH